MDLDVQMGTPLTSDDVFACLDKSQEKIRKKAATETMEYAWESSTFDKVVLSAKPNRRSGDAELLEWRQILTVIGTGGLYGYFEQEKRFFLTKFAVRDMGRFGRGRYVLFGTVRKGKLRSGGGGGSDILSVGNGTVGSGTLLGNGTLGGIATS